MIAQPANAVQNVAGTANFAFGAILIAFLIYITAKGELGTYIQLFFYAAPEVPAASASAAPPATSGVAGAVNSVLSSIPGNPGLSSNPLAGLGL
jgi:hypothetical protein